jgi:hypothetical protein
MDVFAESATSLTNGLAKNVPIVGNAAICVDSFCTTGRAGVNFYCSPNPVSKVFFGANCLCGIVGAAASGTALVTTFTGIHVSGWLGSSSARGCNHLGKYILHMGNVTEIGELMS